MLGSILDANCVLSPPASVFTSLGSDILSECDLRVYVQAEF